MRQTGFFENTKERLKNFRLHVGPGPLLPQNVEEVQVGGLRLSQIEYVSPEVLTPNPLNEYPPLAEDEMAELMEDITDKGILVSLLAKPDGVLLCGHNRRVAALSLALPLVPLQRVLSPLTPEEEKDIMRSENDRRRGGNWPKDRKVDFIREHFADELKADGRGGARRGQKFSEPLKGGASLAKQIEVKSRGKIAEGTAKRLLADIRKEDRKEERKPSVRDKSEDKGVVEPRETAPEKPSERSQKAPDPLKQAAGYMGKLRLVLEGAPVDVLEESLGGLDELRKELRKSLRARAKEAEKPAEVKS